eukprot:g309.t1
MSSFLTKWTGGGGSGGGSGGDKSDHRRRRQGYTNRRAGGASSGGGSTKKTRRARSAAGEDYISRDHLDEDFVDGLSAYGALRVKYDIEESRKTVRYTLDQRQVMDNLKGAFKSMVRSSEPWELLQCVKLLVRTVKDRRDLLEIANAGSSNESMTVLHKQVKACDVLKVGILVEKLTCLDITSEDRNGTSAAAMAAYLSESPGDLHRRIFKYLKEARKSGSITGLVMTPRGVHVPRSSLPRGTDAESDSGQRAALRSMIVAYFNKIDGLHRLRKIVKDASPEKIMKHLRFLKRGLCELSDLSLIIDLKKVGKRDAKTALQKAMDRTDKFRDDVVRALVRAGASSRYVSEKHVAEANAISRALLLEASGALGAGQDAASQRGSSSSFGPRGRGRDGRSSNSSTMGGAPPPLLLPVKPVFGAVLASLVRRDSAVLRTKSRASVALSSSSSVTTTAKNKPGTKLFAYPSIVVPNVVRQCGDFLVEHGLELEGVFRIPGDMSLVKRLKQLFNTTPMDKVDLKAELMYESITAEEATTSKSKNPIGGSSSMMSPSNRRRGGGRIEDPTEKTTGARTKRRSNSFPNLRTAVASTESLKRHSMTVATLLKSFFRELQQPLLSVDFMEQMQKIVKPVLRKKLSRDDAIPLMRETIKGALDRPNEVCLVYLIRLLVRIAENAETNKMTPKNLAVCWAPSLHFNISTPTDLMASIQRMAEDRNVVEFMIRSGTELFGKEEEMEEMVPMADVACDEVEATEEDNDRTAAKKEGGGHG